MQLAHEYTYGWATWIFGYTAVLNLVLNLVLVLTCGIIHTKFSAGTVVVLVRTYRGTPYGRTVVACTAVDLLE